MKSLHLTPDRLTGYLYHTLDDATRESINAHLAACPACRAHLDEHKNLQRAIANELNGTLNQAHPSNRMMFASIADQLKPRAPLFKFWRQVTTASPMAFALAGLVLSIFGILQWMSLRDGPNSVQQVGVSPTFACFFLMLVSVQQFDKALSIRPRFLFMAILAAILWLSSALIGLLNILVLQDLAIYATLLAGGGKTQATPVAMLALLFGAVLYIGFVIGGGEYHYRHLGQPNSWKLFSITLLVQLFILILPYLIF
ncbi:MAG: hypothetical protein Fur0022_10220 [Anaerolineales bacterium]